MCKRVEYVLSFSMSEVLYFTPLLYEANLNMWDLKGGNWAVPPTYDLICYDSEVRGFEASFDFSRTPYYVFIAGWNKSVICENDGIARLLIGRNRKFAFGFFYC